MDVPTVFIFGFYPCAANENVVHSCVTGGIGWGYGTLGHHGGTRWNVSLIFLLFSDPSCDALAAFLRSTSIIRESTLSFCEQSSNLPAEFW